MQAVEQYEFNGSEIWHYLSQLQMHTLCSYDLRLDVLKQRVLNDVVAHIPAAQLDKFKCNFILQHYPASRLRGITRAQFETMFIISLENELRDTLVLSKSLLADISMKFNINLSEDNPHKFRNNEVNEQFLTLFRDTQVQIILGAQETQEIAALLISKNTRYRNVFSASNRTKAPARLALTVDNIQSVLDLPEVGYELNLQHPKFARLFAKLDQYRTTLSNADHVRLFGQPITHPGPFTLRREFAADILRCANVTLTHDQIRNIWLVLSEVDRQHYFVTQEIQSDSIIQLQPGITHAHLLNAASTVDYPVCLTHSQNRQVLSNLTLAQLQMHYKLSYKQGVNAVENSLTSGSQYLSRQYSFSTSSLAQIISVIMAYSFKISMVAAGAIAFVGSLSLGATAAVHQARETMRQEARQRMQHLLNCLEINRLREENESRLRLMQAGQLTRMEDGGSRFEQLVSLVEQAGLAYPFELVIKSCRSITPDENFNPIKVALAHVQQLNDLTINLHDHYELIDAHYNTLEQRYAAADTDDERQVIAYQLAKTQQLRSYLIATRSPDHVPPAQHQQIIYPPAVNMSPWARFKAMAFAPVYRLFHRIKPEGDTLKPYIQAIGAGLLFTFAVVSMAMLFTTLLTPLLIVTACAAVVGGGLGAICYHRVKREMRSEAIGQQAEAIRLDMEDDSRDIEKFNLHCVGLRQLEQQEQNSADASDEQGPPTLKRLRQSSHELKFGRQLSYPARNVDGHNAKIFAENAKLRQDNTHLQAENRQQQEEIMFLRAQLAMQKSAPETVTGAGQSPFAFMKAPPAEEGVKSKLEEGVRSQFDSISMMQAVK